MALEYDVIVVGASTSGLYAARELGAAGKSVAVFERRKELKPARRTLIVTPELREVLPDLPVETVLHRTGTLALVSRRSSAKVRLHKPDLIVERAAITRWLLSQARAAGVDVFLGHRFANFGSGTGNGSVVARRARTASPFP